MVKYPRIYEINTRVFLRRYDSETRSARLNDIPDDFFNSIRQLGFQAVWFMGIWKTSPELIDQCCYQEGLVASYNRALKDWQREDVIGSPYAIDSYSINPDIGSEDDLRELRARMKKFDLLLILDFIPNHFSAASRFLDERPEVFLQCSQEQCLRDEHTFFPSPYKSKFYFAHGRDPFFPAWTDTAQVNYFSPAARAFMQEQLLRIASFCDGIRCDMAMLILNNVFENTWRGVFDPEKFPKPQDEFWKPAIAEVKSRFPEIIFIAEAYWDLEWELQQLGFDYTYDKRLLDRLKNAPVTSIKAHFHADLEYQNKCVRFIENHDEERAVVSLGWERSLCASVILLTVPGVKLIFDGQMEGKKIKLPVQLAREPIEQFRKQVNAHYTKLMHLTSRRIFFEGEWEILEPFNSSPDNFRFENMFAWKWESENEFAVVAVNYSNEKSQCRVLLKLESQASSIEFTDIWTGDKYKRNSQEISSAGLYIELDPWQFHILVMNKRSGQEMK